MRRATRVITWPFAAPLDRLPWRRGRNGHSAEARRRRAGEDEAYTGAAALEDVARGLPANEAAARLAVVRLAQHAAEGRVAVVQLEGERSAVLGYLSSSGCAREEAAALEAAIGGAVPGPGPELADALCRAAAAALAGGCSGGAESLWRAAWAIAAPRRWHAEAARAAAALTVLARADGHRPAVALWRQRALRHERRIERGEG